MMRMSHLHSSVATVGYGTFSKLVRKLAAAHRRRVISVRFAAVAAEKLIPEAVCAGVQSAASLLPGCPKRRLSNL